VKLRERMVADLRGHEFFDQCAYDSAENAMNSQNAYFAAGLLLLMILFALLLQSGFGEQREFIHQELEGGPLFAVRFSTYEGAVYSLPTLIAFRVFCGALGCIQRWVVLAELRLLVRPAGCICCTLEFDLHENGLADPAQS
jgi:hypothetical protein